MGQAPSSSTSSECKSSTSEYKSSTNRQQQFVLPLISFKRYEWPLAQQNTEIIGPSSFSVLPDELVLLVLQHLSPCELAVFSTVSRDCRRLGSDFALWKVICVGEYGARVLNRKNFEKLVLSVDDWAANYRALLQNFGAAWKTEVPDVSEYFLPPDERGLDAPKVDFPACKVKIVTLGEYGVGKSTLMARYVRGTFLERPFQGSIGADMISHTETLRNGQRLNIELWDTAGQERFGAIGQMFYKGANGYVLCFRLDERSTFDAVRKWHRECKDIGCDVLVLVGCQSGARCEAAIERSEAWALATELGCRYCETSAATGLNASRVYRWIALQSYVQLASEAMDNQ